MTLHYMVEQVIFITMVRICKAIQIIARVTLVEYVQLQYGCIHFHQHSLDVFRHYAAFDHLETNQSMLRCIVSPPQLETNV